MPVIHRWLVPNEVVGLYWSGHVTEEELRPMDDILLRLCEETPHDLLNFISDERELLSEPSFRVYLNARSMRHKKFGWYFIVQREQNFTARLLVHMANGILRARVRIVSDPAQAWEQLRHLYPHLTPPAAQTP